MSASASSSLLDWRVESAGLRLRELASSSSWALEAGEEGRESELCGDGLRWRLRGLALGLEVVLLVEGRARFLDSVVGVSFLLEDFLLGLSLDVLLLLGRGGEKDGRARFAGGIVALGGGVEGWVMQWHAMRFARRTRLYYGYYGKSTSSLEVASITESPTRRRPWHVRYYSDRVQRASR